MRPRPNPPAVHRRHLHQRKTRTLYHLHAIPVRPHTATSHRERR